MNPTLKLILTAADSGFVLTEAGSEALAKVARRSVTESLTALRQGVTPDQIMTDDWDGEPCFEPRRRSEVTGTVTQLEVTLDDKAGGVQAAGWVEEDANGGKLPVEQVVSFRLNLPAGLVEHLIGLYATEPDLFAEAMRDRSGSPIVAICGSTRFRTEIEAANRELTLAGHIVLAPGVFGHTGDEVTNVQKIALDALHLEKIRLASAVYVVNPGGYVGESTRAEIRYAERLGKPVSYLTSADRVVA
jgi:hypothetical protein